MNEGFMKKTSTLAIAVAAGLFMGGAAFVPANAADLGGDCCADLEERVADLEATTVRKGNRKVSVKLYGFVTRALLVWDAKIGGTEYSDQYNTGVPYSGVTRFGMTGGAKIGGGWSAGYKLEWGTKDTYPGDTNKDEVGDNTGDDGTDGEGLALRQEYVYLKSATLGRVSLGHQSAAADGITEIDLSGTKNHARSGVQATTIGGTIGGHFNNFDRGFYDSIRYDSPTFAGMKVSASWGEDDYWDVALRYANEFAGVRIAAGVAYTVNGDEGADQELIAGSASALHVGTGLNLTVAAGERDNNLTNTTSSYWWVKAGVKQKFNSLGATAFYGEYGEYDNLSGQQAEMWGLGVAQNIDAAAMQIFAGYRAYDVDNGDEATTGLVGATIKF